MVTERDLRRLKLWMLLLPLISVIAGVAIQYGSLTANSANIEKNNEQQRIEYDKRFERIERDKADADVVEIKFNAVDWKLDLIMKNFNIPYTPPPPSKKFDNK